MSTAGEAPEPGETETEEPAEDVNPDAPVEETTDEPPKPETRAERRAQRAADKKELETLRSTIAEERTARETTARELAEVRGYLQAQAQQTRTAQGDDEMTVKTKALRKEAERHLLAAQTTKSPEIAQAEFDAYHDKLEEAAVMKAHAAIMGDIQRAAGNAPDPVVAQQANRVMAEHPWIGVDRVATAAMLALEDQMVRGGKPPTYETGKAAATEIAKRFGLGGQSNGGGNRGAYSGVRSGESGTGSGGATPMINASSLEKWQRDLAEKAYPKLEGPAAHRAWAAAMNKHLKANPNG